MTSAWLLLASEAGHVPPEHIAAKLAVPIGILLFCGSVYLLLWSNYGAKKGAAIYGTAFFGFCAMLGVFWWFGAPGTPIATGPVNFPGQANDQYAAEWFAMEAGSERAGFFDSTNSYDDFQTVPAFLGIPEDGVGGNETASFLQSELDAAGEAMIEQYLPTDDSENALIGADRRAEFEEAIEEADVPDVAIRGEPFFTAEITETRVTEEEGVQLAAARLQTYANFVDAQDAPLDPVPLDGDGTVWFAVNDPGALWFPSAVWTIGSLLLFGLSLFALDVLEQREKRARRAVEEPEDLATPVAQ